MIRFGIIRFGSVNDTEASVFGYSVSTRFDRPLVYVIRHIFVDKCQVFKKHLEVLSKL